MTVVGKKYIVAIYYRYPARQVNGSIYIHRRNYICILDNKLNIALKGKFFPGRGFSSGAYNTEKTGLGKLWGKCLKQIRVYLQRIVEILKLNNRYVSYLAG